MIKPINGHYHIQPLKREGVMSTHDKNFDAKGIVLTEPGITMEGSLLGKTVYFDAWMAAKFEEDTAQEFWLIPFEAIRAYEG